MTESSLVAARFVTLAHFVTKVLWQNVSNLMHCLHVLSAQHVLSPHLLSPQLGDKMANMLSPHLYWWQNISNLSHCLHVMSPWHILSPWGDRSCWQVRLLHGLSSFTSTTIICLSCSLDVCVCTCMHVSMCVCMYACMSVYVCVCVCVRASARLLCCFVLCSIILVSFSVKLKFCIALSRPPGSCCWNHNYICV